MPGEKSQRRRLAANTAASRPSSSPFAPAWVAPVLIALVALAAYGNSFSSPFVLDDVSSIGGNPSLRRLWPLTGTLSPPAGLGLTVEGRPVLNLSLALNYAISGLNPWSYHGLNLLIHILAGLTLFGVVRRTLQNMVPDEPAAGPHLVAATVALLWTIHPLQTESVTYVIQRAESLMGLFYLLTLYGFIRGAETGGRLGLFWFVLSWLACLFGMATKEVMVSAPVIVFCYDRTFVSGTFREAWRRHGRLYVGLAASWILLGWLAFEAGSRGGTSGFAVGVNPAAYWLAQFPALARYLRLAVWPAPLVFDYGTEWVRDVGDILPGAVAFAALAGGAAWAFLRPLPPGVAAVAQPGHRAAGFAGIWFFAILAPTSLVPGNRQTLAEHRMYLALAPLIAVVVTAAFLAIRQRAGAHSRGSRIVSGGIIAAIAVLFCGMTARRNLDYRSELALFGDTVAKRPDNPYAQGNFGMALLARGRPDAAVGPFEEALRLQPAYPVVENDLGNALQELGRTTEAVDHYRSALRLNPGFADAHSNLGSALVRLGRIREAVGEFETALSLQPDDAEAHNNLGSVLAGAGRLPEAIAQFQEALQLDPGYAAARSNLAKASRQERR